jgi:hypothetical protein
MVCLDFGASETCGGMIIAGSSYPIHIGAMSNACRVPVDGESAQNPHGADGANVASGVPKQLKNELPFVRACGTDLIRYKI